MSHSSPLSKEEIGVIRQQIEEAVPYKKFTYGTAVRAYLVITCCLYKNKRSISLYNVEKILHILGYPKYIIDDCHQILVGTWIVPHEEEKIWWRLSKSASEFFNIWVSQNDRKKLFFDLGTILDGIIAQKSIATAPSPEKRKQAKAVGTTLFFHYDPGEKDRIIQYLKKSNMFRNIIITHWDQYEKEIITMSDAYKVAELKATDQIQLIPVELEKFPDITELTEWSEIEINDLLRKINVPSYIKKIMQIIKIDSREELIIHISTFPRQTLFILFLLLNYEPKPYAHKWEYINPIEHQLINPRLGPSFITKSSNDSIGNRFMFFYENDPYRLSGLSSEICNTITSEIYLGVPINSTLETEFTKKIPFESFTSIKMDLESKMDIYRNLIEIKPDVIFVNGNRHISIAVFQFYLENLKGGSPLPKLIFTHLYSTNYTKGAGEKETLVFIPPQPETSYV